MDIKQIFDRCQSLQSDALQLFIKEYHLDVDKAPYDTVQSISSGNYAMCFSRNLVTLAKAVDQITTALCLLEELQEHKGAHSQEELNNESQKL